MREPSASSCCFLPALVRTSQKGNNPLYPDIQTRTALRRWRSSAARFPQSSCGEGDQAETGGLAHYSLLCNAILNSLKKHVCSLLYKFALFSPKSAVPGWVNGSLGFILLSGMAPAKTESTEPVVCRLGAPGQRRHPYKSQCGNRDVACEWDR